MGDDDYIWQRWLISVVILFLICQSGFAVNDFKYGSKVMAYDIDESRALSIPDTTPAFGFWDVGVAGFDPGDPVYLDFGANGLIDENDLRLTPFGDLTPGTKVSKLDNDCGQLLDPFSRNAAPSYFDVFGDGAYSIEDPVYLDTYPFNRVNANDIRITSYLGYLAGSRVAETDADNNMPTVVLPGIISFYNTNGNIDSSGDAIYDAGDVVYIDAQSPRGMVTVNDIRITI